MLRSRIPKSLKRARLVDISHPFNKSLCINIGIRVASTSIVSVMDADIIFSREYLEEIVSCLKSERCFVTSSQSEESAPVQFINSEYIETLQSEAYMHFRFRDGREVRLRTYNAEMIKGRRAGPGLLTARKDDLCSVGGFNSNLVHWGWEDIDIQIRLMHVLGLERKEVGTVLHLSHSDDERNLGSLSSSRDKSLNLNMRKCIEAYNRGHFQGTYVTDQTNEHRVINV
jgi:predicted glycosyltransferase involved in capsule biosynthesis